MNAILDGLNEEQKKAVQCVEGPVLIVAGAGSGKTRVLTSRIAYILSSGVEASRILSLTFTKKAAGEMKERIAVMVGAQNARRLVMGTFHSVFVRFLRGYASFLGYPDSFTIYDTSDSQSAIKACLKELDLDDKVYKPRDVLSRISKAKNNLVTVSAYRANRDLLIQDSHGKHPRIVDIYERYQQKMKQAGVMDFDDILLNMNILLRDNPDALNDIADRFSYIMVDEYQDTNYAQYIILKKLARCHHNICVVGDDSQSIYAFRGAKIENILNFKKDYPECRLFRLERNYRSTCNIVGAANSVIARNSGRIPKECYSVGEDGEKIRLLHSYSESEEAMAVVGEILTRTRTDSAQYQDFAILYRTNSQSRAFEEQLRRRNIPYMIYSGNSFFDRAEVKDLMAYFKLSVNPGDDEAFKRAINKPARGIGDTSVSALNECARAHSCSLFQAAFQEDTELYGLKPAALAKIRTFCNMINGFFSMFRTTDAFDMARRIADDSGIYAFYKSDNSIEGLARTANVDELVNSVQAFIEERREEMEVPDDNAVFTLDDYIENVSLLSNVDVTDSDDTNNKVALMTVHSAKGLEFKYVFVVGMEENLFPSMNMVASLNDLEEERRLFYVAITRAMKSVFLSFASSRMRNGKHESNAPSRFIKEIDASFIENPLDDDDFRSERENFRFGSGASPLSGDRFRSLRSLHPSQPHGWAPPSNVSEGGHTYSGQRAGAAVQSRIISGERAKRAEPISGESTPTAAVARKPEIIDPNFVPVPMTELYEGERIEHNRFGAGTIKAITGTAPEMKAVIFFDDYGEKLLLLKYAKLRPLKV